MAMTDTHDSAQAPLLHRGVLLEQVAADIWRVAGRTTWYLTRGELVVPGTGDVVPGWAIKKNVADSIYREFYRSAGVALAEAYRLAGEIQT